MTKRKKLLALDPYVLNANARMCGTLLYDSLLKFAQAASIHQKSWLPGDSFAIFPVYIVNP